MDGMVGTDEHKKLPSTEYDNHAFSAHAAGATPTSQNYGGNN
jgi:hypothetical protein